MESGLDTSKHPSSSVHPYTRLRTGWALTGSFQNRIGALQSAACVCGEVQDVRHIIEDCPYLSPPNGLNGLTQLDDDTIEWLYRTDIDL